MVEIDHVVMQMYYVSQTKQDETVCFDLAAFGRPDRFLHCVMQTFARKQFKDLYKCCMEVQVRNFIMSLSVIQSLEFSTRILLFQVPFLIFCVILIISPYLLPGGLLFQHVALFQSRELVKFWYIDCKLISNGKST